MTPANTLKSMSMSQVIEAYNALATANGKTTVTEFKSLSFARSELNNLEQQVENQASQTTDTGAAVAGTAEGTVVHAAAGDASKYDSRDKRGPNQGVGAFAKEQLMLGKNNSDTLAAVMQKFPAAKTSKGCIAFYRTALQRDGKLAKGGGVIPADPVSMEAKAAKLKEEAAALEAQAVEVRAKLEADATAKANAEAEQAAAANTAQAAT